MIIYCLCFYIRNTRWSVSIELNHDSLFCLVGEGYFKMTIPPINVIAINTFDSLLYLQPNSLTIRVFSVMNIEISELIPASSLNFWAADFVLLIFSLKRYFFCLLALIWSANSSRSSVKVASFSSFLTASDAFSISDSYQAVLSSWWLFQTWSAISCKTVCSSWYDVKPFYRKVYPERFLNHIYNGTCFHLNQIWTWKNHIFRKKNTDTWE